MSASATIERIENITREHAFQLHARAPRFRGFGHIGIWHRSYAGQKSRFMFEQLCYQRLRRGIKQICEVGFNAGESAILFLEAAPEARIISFDIPHKHHPWLRTAAELVQRLYAKDRFEIVLGDSQKMVPQTAQTRSELRCDVMFIDGGKDRKVRLADLHNFQKLASGPESLLLLDEIVKPECAAGKEPLQSCSRWRTPWTQATLAYHEASQAGVIQVNVSNCVMTSSSPHDGGNPVPHDGMCAAKFML